MAVCWAGSMWSRQSWSGKRERTQAGGGPPVLSKGGAGGGELPALHLPGPHANVPGGGLVRLPSPGGIFADLGSEGTGSKAAAAPAARREFGAEVLHFRRLVPLAAGSVSLFFQFRISRRAGDPRPACCVRRAAPPQGEGERGAARLQHGRRVRRKKNRQTRAVSPSAMGKASHRPVMPQTWGSRTARGRMRRKPRSREMRWAGRGMLVEVK